MPGESEASLLRSVQTLFSAGSLGGLPDRELLERFLSRRDPEAAFAALLALYGPMVWDLCHGVLGDAQDTEDAFQATFLVLVRRASAIRRRDAIGPWLYGVARRVAARAKANAARRRAREIRAVAMLAEPTADVIRQEQVEALYEEVDRLKEKQRAAVVLCYLEGRTHSEAARLLHCPVGTISVRLSRARELLRARLTRRGLALPAAFVGEAPGRERISQVMPSALAVSTAQAAMRLADGKLMTSGVISGSVARLTEGVLRSTMLSTRLIAGTVVLAVGSLATIVVLHGRAVPPADPAMQKVSVAPTPSSAPRDGRNAIVGATAAADAPPVGFFGLRDRARSVVYAIDCSGSMVTRNSFAVAKHELMASVRKLSPRTRFAVVFYNLETRILADSGKQRGMMAPTASNVECVDSQLAEIEPLGGTDHVGAVRAALALKPEVIFLLTDAELLFNSELDEIRGQTGSTRIQIVEFGFGSPPEHTPLRRLATATGGGYEYKERSLFPR